MKKIFWLPVAGMVIGLTSFIVANHQKTAVPVPAVVQQPEDGFCGIKNTAFQATEQVQFIVFYNVIGVYVHAGDATFTCNLEKMNNKPVYHVEGIGNSNSKYDWIFKVRDKYESYIDTATLLPYKFVRNISEGKYKKQEIVSFNQSANTATSQKSTYKVPKCVQDVISATYYARNIDFNSHKPGDKITFSMVIDDEVFSMYVKYIGKEKVKTKYGKFNAVKFKPLLIKGTIFEGGEKMTVWVSDDANHLPLRVESPITVGSVKVDMMGYRNLRHPLSSLISFKN
jgi:hypothetical protein